jgi:hypothetical protein
MAFIVLKVLRSIFMKLILIFSLLLSSIMAFAQTRKDLAPTDKAQVLEVLSKHDALFNALINNDFKAAEPAALALKTALEKSTTAVLKTAKAQAVSLSQIKGNLGGEKNLALYEKVSNPLVEVVKGYNLGSGYNIFSCPMVKKSWVQNMTQHKDVRNVYATSMLECGSQDTKF